MDGRRRTDWADAGNWSPAGVPDAGSDVTIASGTPLALASASIGTVNSIADSSYLSFGSAGTDRVATFLDDAGHLYVDAKGGDERNDPQHRGGADQPLSLDRQRDPLGIRTR